MFNHTLRVIALALSALELSALVLSSRVSAEQLADPTRPLGFVAVKKDAAKSLRLNSASSGGVVSISREGRLQ